MSNTNDNYEREIEKHLLREIMQLKADLNAYKQMKDLLKICIDKKDAEIERLRGLLKSIQHYLDEVDDENGQQLSRRITTALSSEAREGEA